MKKSGQSLVEYVLILALISVVSITVLYSLGQQVKNLLLTVSNKMAHAGMVTTQSNKIILLPVTTTDNNDNIDTCNNGHGNGHAYGNCN